MATGLVFPGTRLKTHMPFCDGKDLLYCAAAEVQSREFACGGVLWNRLRQNAKLVERFKDLPRSSVVRYRPWKLHYTPWKTRQPVRLETGLPADSVECAPAFYRDSNDIVHISFVGGIPNRQRLQYHLYTMSGPSFAELRPAQKLLSSATAVGFLSPLHLCYGLRGELVLRKREDGQEVLLKSNLRRITRVAFRPDDPNCLVLTGIDEQQNSQTVLCDLEHDTAQELSTPEGAYKGCVFGDEVVFARKSVNALEDRQLLHGKYTLGQTAISIRQIARNRSMPVAV